GGHRRHRVGQHQRPSDCDQSAATNHRTKSSPAAGSKIGNGERRCELLKPEGAVRGHSVLFATSDATNALRARFLAGIARALVASKFYGGGYSFNPDFLVVVSQAGFAARPLCLCFFDTARHRCFPLHWCPTPLAPKPQEFQYPRTSARPEVHEGNGFP